MRTAVVAIAAVLGVGLALAWIESARRVRDVGAARVEAKLAELDQAYQASANRVALTMQFEELEAMLGFVSRHLPSRLDAAAIEQALRTSAEAVGIEVLRVDARDEEAKEFYAKLPVELRLRGANAPVYGFLAELTQAAPLRHVVALRVAPRDDARDVLLADVTIELFRYRDDGELRDEL